MEYIRFKEVTLSTQYGYTAEETSKTDGVYKYLRITDIVPYFVDFDTVPYCSIPQKKVDQYLVQEGDVLIARTGATTGYNYVVPKGIENTIYASYLIRFIVDKSQILPLYLKYVLKGDYYYGFVNNYIGGSAQPGMNARVFGRFNIPYNTIPTQRRIASILSAYDNLIENNNRRIRLLEQMAENLYKEWFVRFRFPGHEKVEMENGLPKGWKKASLGEICQFKRGKNITSDEMCEGNIPVISAGIEASGFHNRSNVKGVSVTMSSSGANAGFLSIHYSDIWAADCSYIEESSTTNIYYVYELLNNIRTIITNFQRGAAQPHVYPKDINRIKLIVPDKNLMRKANEKLLSMHKAIDTLQQQNQLLTRQRDLLLPRLMSGKLEVNA
ncbi:MAG: restriction endonuclease subunit S [Paludibacteraceae bacterium]|nr:restriction endonuclease subunit S [Paludibacteraceae bacterium]